GGTSTDVGDLTVILKYALYNDRQAGNVFSAGLAVTAPTGPDAFANFNNVTAFHNTTLQPFIGYLWTCGDFFVHGFVAVDVPTAPNDVPLLYNALGVAYFLSRTPQSDCLIKAFAPTFEVHVNPPLTPRGAFRFDAPAATADVVDLTVAANFE